MDVQSDFLLTPELAVMLRTPEATIRYWRHTGYGPPGFTLGRRVVYRRSEVETWLKTIEDETGGAA